jgi:putative transposase
VPNSFSGKAQEARLAFEYAKRAIVLSTSDLIAANGMVDRAATLSVSNLDVLPVFSASGGVRIGQEAVAEVIRKMGISEQTFYRWKKLYAGMGVAELRRLKQLEEENRKLKQLVADLSLDKIMLQDVIRSKL